MVLRYLSTPEHPSLEIKIQNKFLNFFIFEIGKLKLILVSNKEALKNSKHKKLGTPLEKSLLHPWILV